MDLQDRRLWLAGGPMDGLFCEREPFMLRYLRVLRELLTFVLFSYTVLLGALLLAGWTTYFMVVK